MQKQLLESLFNPKGPFEGNELQNISCIQDGSKNKAWKLDLSDGRKFFAKTGDKHMLQAESKSLKKLSSWADHSLIIVPKPYLVQEISGTSLLLTPWLDLTGGDQILLGRGLALIHKKSAEQSPGNFGWDSDGYIGLGPQPGGWIKDWGECFVQLRLIPQMKIATKWGLEIRDFESLLIDLVDFLNQHSPSPSLVHGDLWSGNASVLLDGRGALIDPASWWADREVDIAMSKLFGGFSKSFYEGYEEIWPLKPKAHERVEIYNLYHLLNHANIFGGSYQKQSISSLERIKRQVSYEKDKKELA